MGHRDWGRDPSAGEGRHETGEIDRIRRTVARVENRLVQFFGDELNVLPPDKRGGLALAARMKVFSDAEFDRYNNLPLCPKDGACIEAVFDQGSRRLVFRLGWALKAPVGEVAHEVLHAYGTYPGLETWEDAYINEAVTQFLARAWSAREKDVAGAFCYDGAAEEMEAVDRETKGELLHVVARAYFATGAARRAAFDEVTAFTTKYRTLAPRLNDLDKRVIKDCHLEEEYEAVKRAKGASP